jgi:hypothetical protein
MNVYLIENSLKYIKTNFEIIVKLSKWIYDKLDKDLYNDNKFIKSVIEKEDIVIARYLRDKLIHKKIFIWDFHYIEGQFNILQSKYFLTSEWIKLLKLNNRDSYDNFIFQDKCCKKNDPKLLKTLIKLIDDQHDLLCLIPLMKINNQQIPFDNIIKRLKEIDSENDKFWEIRILINYNIISHNKYELLHYILNNGHYKKATIRHLIIASCLENDKNIIQILINYNFNLSSFIENSDLRIISRSIKNDDIINLLKSQRIYIINNTELLNKVLLWGSPNVVERIMKSEGFEFDRNIIVNNIHRYSYDSIQLLINHGFSLESKDDDIIKKCLKNLYLYRLIIRLGIKIMNDETFIFIDRYKFNILLQNDYVINSNILLKLIENNQISKVKLLLDRGITHPDAYQTAMRFNRTNIAKIIRNKDKY